MEEKESDGAEAYSEALHGEALSTAFNEALNAAVAHIRPTSSRSRILRLAKHGVNYAFALMSKLQADMVEEIAVTAARAAGRKERAAQHDLMQAAHSVVRPGTGMDARPPPEEKK